MTFSRNPRADEPFTAQSSAVRGQHVLDDGPRVPPAHLFHHPVDVGVQWGECGPAPEQRHQQRELEALTAAEEPATKAPPAPSPVRKSARAAGRQRRRLAVRRGAGRDRGLHHAVVVAHAAQQQCIEINALCPGSVGGERIERVIHKDAEERGVGPDAIRTIYQRQSSLRAFATAEDIAAMVCFLAGPGGRMISGQTIGIDGHTESLANSLDE